METKEKIIERIAKSTGQYYGKVEADVNSVISTNASQTLKELSDEMRNIKISFPPYRRGGSNYTKPKNRKKKPKY
ncbi:hypothetical protein SAMN05421768_103679 [Chryseobacterium joostei]|nr:hypothetical protein [Chryseobacterium joostei]SIS34274.1 hypothetical protein SAMN05421768_103679 [Chryseobacterium joostei]